MSKTPEGRFFEDFRPGGGGGKVFGVRVVGVGNGIGARKGGAGGVWSSVTEGSLGACHLW